MPRTSTLTIKQLHNDTGRLIRRVGSMKRPVAITDHGQEVAVLANRSLLRPAVRKRTLLPDYAAMLAKPPRTQVLAALDQDRDAR